MLAHSAKSLMNICALKVQNRVVMKNLLLQANKTNRVPLEFTYKLKPDTSENNTNIMLFSFFLSRLNYQF